MSELSHKLPGVGTTIFTVMSALAQEHDAVNLSQGFPDFPVAKPLLDLMDKYLRAGHNQYPPMIGVPYLREQVARKIAAVYHVNVDMDHEITVTSGATEALFVAIQATIGQGDEAIVFDPAYDSYAPAVALAGGVTRHIPLSSTDFSYDWARVREAITPRTRLIIVNSPHNPCGRIMTEADLTSLAEIVRDHDVFVLSDEVYEHMVFDQRRHLTLLTHADLRERTFVVSSFGKTCHATGWKVGYCVAPPRLSTEFRQIHQFVTFTTHTPTQWALAEYLDTCPEHYLTLPAFYQAKRDLFLGELNGTGFKMTPSQATYFQTADYSNITDMGDVDFARYLTTEIGVAAIPVSAFCETPPDRRLIRFCFAKNDATLRLAATRLRQLEPM